MNKHQIQLQEELETLWNNTTTHKQKEDMIDWINDDEAIPYEILEAFEKKFSEELWKREEMIENNFCPDCETYIKDNSYCDSDTGYNNVSDFSCAC